MDNEQVTEVALPNINSSNSEERIAARRLRVAKAEERAVMGEDHMSEEAEEKEEPSKSIQQIEFSRQRLKKLESDGTQLVTNIRVAGDARESQRRAEYEESARIRKEKMEQEAKTSAERLEEINKKWDIALQKDIPQSLHEALLQQKLACDALRDEKNKLINDFQQELKMFDDRYVKDLKKQADDIDLLVERMEEQLKTQNKSLRDELDLIERAFLSEREETLELHKKKWEEKLDYRRMKEQEYLEARQKRVNDFEEQIHQVRLQDAEEYQQVKIKLETEVQVTFLFFCQFCSVPTIFLSH
ncbi:DRC1 [Acanthosepion pharaonis]|uniref:DRC1 n=1 Tax=Acanthosepion pharaonis TaxID=158019 RepID=A0A812DE19_ACAPH|nr:DRC1 [Sepia pharaonis]